MNDEILELSKKNDLHLMATENDMKDKFDLLLASENQTNVDQTLFQGICINNETKYYIKGEFKQIICHIKANDIVEVKGSNILLFYNTFSNDYNNICALECFGKSIKGTIILINKIKSKNKFDSNLLRAKFRTIQCKRCHASFLYSIEMESDYMGLCKFCYSYYS